MTRLEVLVSELTHEARTARKHLERLRDAQLDWRPHTKSFTAGQLGSHLVDCIRWTSALFSTDGLDLDERPYRPFLATAVAALLEAFDAEVDAARRAMSTVTDRDASLPWRGLTLRRRTRSRSSPRPGVRRPACGGQSGASPTTPRRSRSPSRRASRSGPGRGHSCAGIRIWRSRAL